MILSFFFYWVLKSSQSFFFYSNCLYLIVAAFAYATILFISFTSSNYSWAISTALWFIAPLFSNFSFSNSSKGNFFFFYSYNRNIYSLFALANDNLYYFYSSASLLSCSSSSLVGFRIVSFIIFYILSFFGDRSLWECQFKDDYSFYF
jgi:hypothetical protein